MSRVRDEDGTKRFEGVYLLLGMSEDTASILLTGGEHADDRRQQLLRGTVASAG